jgi:hypothetical protein
VFRKLTPIITVERIEPCLAFWERLGFTRTVEVPLEDALGFAMLERDGIEVMYQSRASVAADVPALAEDGSRSVLYLEVEELDGLLAALDPASIVVPRRKTFYGADEVFVRAPCGTVVGFAVQSG